MMCDSKDVKLDARRRSVEASSETSYCEREPWDDWGSRSTLSQLEEVSTQSSGRADELSSLKAERDALSRALSAERARAASAARAHDARLAELHGVIAELVRRRAGEKHSAPIPEELSDECDSTTQPAGELDCDGDESRTDQHSSAASPRDTTDTSGHCKAEEARGESPVCVACDTADGRLCADDDRCCERARSGADSCDRQHGSADRVYTASPGRCESRQAKVASRVKLRKTEDTDSNQPNDESWWSGAEQLALEVCAHADLREALVQANNDGASLSLHVGLWRARCARLAADARVLRCALARATDTAHRLSCACAVQESCCVSLCCALRAADRALETYDVLLALAETQGQASPERAAAERVACQQLAALEAGPRAALGEPLLSAGPWLQHHHTSAPCAWDPASEARLRAHAARLKADTVALRDKCAPQLYSVHDADEDEVTKSVGNISISTAEMEAAVVMQEVLLGREARAARALQDTDTESQNKSESADGERRHRHWLHSQASETDL